MYLSFKKTLAVLLLLALPVVLPARQKTLTGLWTGNLNNNDSVVRKDLSFEIALTQYKDRVYGYCRRTFLVNDTLYYVVKRVKGKVEDGVCEVKDDEYLSHNFARVDKGVKLTYTFHLNEKDSNWVLDGNWKTNQVKKKFYAIDGTVQMVEDKNYEQSRLFDHLEELGLAKDVAFYQQARYSNFAGGTPAAKQKQPDKQPSATAAVRKSEKEKSSKASLPEQAANNKETKGETVATPVKKEPVAAAAIAERTMAAPQQVWFAEDSLELALYDNGEIDGDTVSVLLNGELLLARECLKATAIKKTIYLPAGTDSAVLTLYAENLGRYPPNTGLLVVYDGETRHQVRFSADLNQNASVIFRRRQK